jgi:hypothetical protein
MALPDMPPKLTGAELSDYLTRHEDARRAASASRGSPAALEDTLASISDEVTAEAIERRRREATEDGAKVTTRP